MTDPEDRPPTHDCGQRNAVPPHRRRLSMFGRSVTLPQSQLLRLSIGILLCIGGLFGFLPVVGIWMLPLGIAVLSIDIPFVRRHSRRAAIYLRKRYPRTAGKLFPRSR